MNPLGWLPPLGQGGRRPPAHPPGWNNLTKKERERYEKPKKPKAKKKGK
jgi:hypothetical protein